MLTPARWHCRGWNQCCGWPQRPRTGPCTTSAARSHPHSDSLSTPSASGHPGARARSERSWEWTRTARTKPDCCFRKSNSRTNTMNSPRLNQLQVWARGRSLAKPADRLLLMSYAVVSLLMPAPASAQSIFGGRLCSGFQAVVNNELISVVVLVACVGAILLWLLDDGQSKVKVFALRLAGGIASIFGIATVVALISGRNLMCTIGA